MNTYSKCLYTIVNARLASRCVPLSIGGFPSRPPSSSLHPHHLPAELPRCPLILALLLDRSGVGAGAYLPEHPDDPDDHDPELRSASKHARRLVHEGDRRLDGDLPSLRLRRLHRILDCQHAPSTPEGENVEERSGKARLYYLWLDGSAYSMGFENGLLKSSEGAVNNR